MKQKVVHLHLKESFNNETEYYFGSISAIYDIVPKELVGISYRALTNALRGVNHYENRKVIIHVGIMYRKAQTNNEL